MSPAPDGLHQGTRTQHTSSTLPMSSAATRSMISSLSCVLASVWPLLRLIEVSRRPQERWAWMERSNPRAGSNTERPVSWLLSAAIETEQGAAPADQFSISVDSSQCPVWKRPRRSSWSESAGQRPQPIFQPEPGVRAGNQRLGRSVAPEISLPGDCPCWLLAVNVRE